MAHCDEYIDLMSAALDGALSPEEQIELEAHLAQCPDCKALYEDLEQLHQSLQDLPPVEVPAGLTDRIMEAVAAEAEGPKVVPLPKPKKPSRTWQRWAVTAAAVAVVILGARTMQGDQASGDNIVAPAQALPSEAVSAESGLRAYTDEADLPEPDTAGPNIPENTDSGISDPTGGTETAPANGALVPEGTPRQADKTASNEAPIPEPTDLPRPSASTAPPMDETPLPAYTAAPRMAVSAKVSSVPEDTGADEESAVEEEDTSLVVQSQSTGFVAQVQAPQEPPTLPEDNEGAPEIPAMDNMLMTNECLPPVSEDEDPEESLPLTQEDALSLVVERCFGNSGYEMVREDLEDEPLSCSASLLDGEDVVAGGTIVYTGEEGEFFLFECHWDDDPENPYHYSVHKIEGYVIWQGELGNGV